MSAPVVHFEIIGKDPDRLRRFYKALFGWDGEISPTSDLVSDAGQYTFIDPLPVPGAPGPAGGIGGGRNFAPNILFYVAVADVGAALDRVEELGGSRVFGPASTPSDRLVVGRFTDPEGNLVGLAGPK
jgi:predicted enzyme related to lactoylglutathione lyase